MDVQSIIDAVCTEHIREPRYLKNLELEGDESFTTGDLGLDGALGGGIRTGMIWEIVGERYF